MAAIGGVILAIVGSTGESLGLTLQKLSHDRELAKAEAEGRAPIFYLKQRMWWIGIIVFTVGNILDFVAFGLTGASVVIVVGCWALVVNLYTAPKILKEDRSIIDLIAGGMIISGISMAVGALLASGREDPEWTAEELVDRFIQPLVLVLLAIVIAIVIACYISTRLYARKYPHLHLALTGTKHTDGPADEAGAESGAAAVHEVTNISPAIRYQHVLLAASVGTLTVVTAKATSEIIVQSVSGENQFKGFAIVIVFLFIFSLPAQLHFINVSLMINDALFHIPVFYVFWQVGVTVVGGVLYKEFVGFQPWQWALYLIGILILFAGIKVAAKRLAAVEQAMREDASTIKAPETIEQVEEAVVDMLRMQSEDSQNETKSSADVINGVHLECVEEKSTPSGSRDGSPDPEPEPEARAEQRSDNAGASSPLASPAADPADLNLNSPRFFGRASKRLSSSTGPEKTEI